eukprot:TRINITY_DN71958_c0_g1_i1.p1 TRINITY_DN71958_c0_g1~~TRINITY_DN71958_c0_g1_i1.p1  ORF type:complete len:177 (-),score=23.53 TRINITY_DN71958_c0_g1_i1:148-678(-)
MAHSTVHADEQKQLIKHNAMPSGSQRHGATSGCGVLAPRLAWQRTNDVDSKGASSSSTVTSSSPPVRMPVPPKGAKPRTGTRPVPARSVVCDLPCASLSLFSIPEAKRKDSSVTSIDSFLSEATTECSSDEEDYTSGLERKSFGRIDTFGSLASVLRRKKPRNLPSLQDATTDTLA